jgi:3-hydroxybutyryl-CoA dehydrogenase
MGEIVGILGAGQMGSGIAQVAAQSEMEVLIYDLIPEALARSVKTVSASCDRLIKKETMTTSQKDSLLKHIQTTTNFNDLSKADFLIEAVTEKEDLKLEIFRKLDGIAKESAILASNTSSISITKIGGVTKRPENVVGMHFMNPVPIMKLVEGIRGLATSPETFLRTKDLANKMGKTFVEANDSPGFIVNRILMPMINEAVFALHEGVAEALAIDTAMKLGTNQPMGPLALADFIGLDTCLAIMKVLHTEYGDSKYRPCPLLVKYVEAGWFGKKTGRGFYQYEDQKK